MCLAYHIFELDKKLAAKLPRSKNAKDEPRKYTCMATALLGPPHSKDYFVPKWSLFLARITDILRCR